MLQGYFWCVVAGFAFCMVDAFVVGATTLYLAWGPAVAAGCVSYRTAILVGAACQFVGALALGPHSFGSYLGILKAGQHGLSPELVMYALLVAAFVLPIWQLLALWQQAPTASYLGAVFSLLGTALLYPGWQQVDFGAPLLNVPPFLSGLGPVYSSWAFVPTLALVCVALLFLILRNCILRGDDPFYRALWCMPALATFTTIVNVSFILYAIQSPTGSAIHHLTPQGGVIVIISTAIFVCIGVTACTPVLLKRMIIKAPKPVPVRHMNLLGLPDDVVQDIAMDAVVPTRLTALYRFLFELDMNNNIRGCSGLMQMHSTAEVFDRATEAFFIKPQILTCMLLSLSFGVSAVGVMFPAAGIAYIWYTGSVPAAFPIPISVRAAGAVMMFLGAIVGGRRLMPVTGVQLVRMTPFRSYVAVIGAAVATIFARQLQLNNGMRTYISISAVVAVGMVEGLGQVNWRRVGLVVAWWLLGPLPLIAVACFIYWQGTRVPSLYDLQALKFASNAMNSSITLIADALGNVTLTQNAAALQHYYAVHPQEGKIQLLQEAMSQLLAAYNSTLTCNATPVT